MFFNKQPAAPVETLAHQFSDSADRALTSAQDAANGAIDSLADSVVEMRQQAASTVHSATRAADRASALAHQSADRLRGSARHASEVTVSYIKNEPLKSVLIAASTGAVLMALVSLLGASRSHR